MITVLRNERFAISKRPKEFPDGQVKYFYLDWERKVAEFGHGIEIPLRPFPGTLGVARAQPGRYNAVPPGPFAGNLDNRELVEGTTLHVPVFVRGALVWTGTRMLLKVTAK